MLRRGAALTLRAVVFGTVPAGTFYGVNALLPQEDSSVASAGAVSAGAVLTSLASTSYFSARCSMDGADIAAAALPRNIAALPMADAKCALGPQHEKRLVE